MSATEVVPAWKKALEEFGVFPETSELLSGSQRYLENATFGAHSKDRMYGALPYFGRREEIAANINKELAILSKHYDPKEELAWRSKIYAEGADLFEMKFGRKLSEFAEEILAHYPDLHKEGRVISVFGLSGSGKSIAIEAYREHLNSQANTVVMIDSDTVRYNLFAKMVKEAELSALDPNDTQGREAKGEEVKQLIHNRISGSLYFLLNHVSHELKNRGYTVFMSSTQPSPGADETIYVEHPDGIDVKNIPDNQEEAPKALAHVAKELHSRTEQRVSGKDNYDWDKAETITDFNVMHSVTVQVPEDIHMRLAAKVAEFLNGDTNNRIKILHNPVTTDVATRNKNFADQLDKILSESSE